MILHTKNGYLILPDRDKTDFKIAFPWNAHGAVRQKNGTYIGPEAHQMSKKLDAIIVEQQVPAHDPVWQRLRDLSHD